MQDQSRTNSLLPIAAIGCRNNSTSPSHTVKDVDGTADTAITQKKSNSTSPVSFSLLQNSAVNSNNNNNLLPEEQFENVLCNTEPVHSTALVDKDLQQHIPKCVPKMCNKHPPVDISLDGCELWEEFYKRGTEMIVNRAGRRMFPGFSVAVSGLKPKGKYTMKVEVVLANNHRFKFLNSRWLAVGNAEPQAPSEVYLHPDSPNTGSFWMRHGISFRKLKITNNKDKPGQNALLHSMHKYYLRLCIDEERRSPTGEPKILPRNIYTQDFIETSFIAVTAYQNEEVTQLKITNNPFAKAFRENGADMDWETAQMVYGTTSNHSNYSNPSHSYHNSGYSPSGQYYQSNQWAMGSSNSTHSLNTLPPHLNSLTVNSSVYSAVAPSPITTTGHYFQWPQQSPQYIHSTQPPPPPPPLPSHTQPLMLPSVSSYYQSAVVVPLRDSSPLGHFTRPHIPLQHLPDFDSVFTDDHICSNSHDR